MLFSKGRFTSECGQVHTWTTILWDSEQCDFQLIDFNGLKLHWIISKVVHEPLLKMHCNRIVWYYCTMCSGAVKRTAFAAWVWGVVKLTLTPSADCKCSAFCMFWCELTFIIHNPIYITHYRVMFLNPKSLKKMKMTRLCIKMQIFLLFVSCFLTWF